MAIAAQKGEMSDPANILKKGYSITTYNGKLVKDLSDLKKEEMIATPVLYRFTLKQDHRN